jgi:murein L,D-transpeptidase YcbB/YkuD
MKPFLSLVLVLVLLFLPQSLVAAHAESLETLLRQRFEVANLKEGLRVGGCDLSSLYILPRLYQQRDYRPIWVSKERIDQLVTAIQETYLDGLDPQDYYLNEIQELLATRAYHELLGTDQALTLELLLTDAYIRLVHHSSCGKEDPLTYHPQWNFNRTIFGLDPVTLIAEGLDDPDLSKAITTWKIDHPSYERLKNALAQYRALRSAGGWEPIPDGPTLKMGMSGPRVEALRKRLRSSGDLSDTTPSTAPFDQELEQAVRRFQNRHALKTDGEVGQGTLKSLNVPLEERIDQIRVNLERARWVLSNLGDRYVLVDIAGYRVFYRQDEKTLWSCRAQVGKPYRNTPVFRSQINSLEINPTWTVPPTILNEDILPAVKADRRYLIKKNLVILDAQERPVDEAGINWSLYPGRPFPYQIRQNPGPDNPLGRIKILFPNKYMVYLHGTPSMNLFEQEERALSSGCIRLERPFELAELLLNDPVHWNGDSFRRAVQNGKTQRVFLPRPVTILLLYWTVEVDDQGLVLFKQDPYGRDPAVLAGLGRDAEIRY